MAGKSLLQQFGWSCGKNKVKDVENVFSGKPGKMEGSHMKSDKGPPKKKRKTEDEWGEETEGLWDDSVDFTEDDLDNIELQASQAITQTKQETKVVPSTSASVQRVLQPLQQQTISEQSRFVKPQLSRSSSSTSSRSHSLQSSNNASGQSKTSAQSSRSSYPESLSGYSNKTSSSSSLRSGSSVESVQGQMSRTHSRLGSEGHDVSSGNQATITELNTTRQECASLKLQLENLKQEVYMKDGENRVLRDNLTKKNTELDTIKMEKISQIHQQNIHQSEKEKNLQSEVSKLQTQLQFKSQEERELTNRCKELQVQLRNYQAAGSSTQGFLSSQSVSPKPTRVLVEERSPRSQPAFPSRRTFMAEEVSPVKKSQPTVSGDNQRAESSTSDTSSASKVHDTRRKCGLKLRKSTNTSTGTQLVSRLFDIAPSKTGTVIDKGILGLLSTTSASVASYKIQFERDKNTSLLSPIRGRRLSDLYGLLTRADKPDFVSLVSVNHFNMAVQGLSCLIKSENQSADRNISDSSQSTGSESQENSALHDAVLVLPFINDYLKHYIEMFEATLETSEGSSTTTATLSSSSSGSFDTSSESLTGSFGSFIRSSASWANELECLAIASVETLYELLSSSAVKDILLHSECKPSPRTPSTSAEFESSDSDMDIQWRESPTKLSCIRKYVTKLNILKKILKLSNAGNRIRLCNSKMITSCLEILRVLAIHSDEKQITCLLPVLSEECLQNCLDHETDTHIVINSLQLFKTLLKSNQVVSSLCSNATGCVLLTVYNLCLTKKFTNVRVNTRLTISSLIIDSLLYMASSHRGCFTLVLESDCLCSAEVVKSVVTLLHSVMKIHKVCSSKRQRTPDHSEVHLKHNDSLISNYETSLKILQTGLHLLHLMSQFDSEFVNRHQPVQHKYVQLICGLSHMFRNMKNESELNAVQDLWDFNQDDSELSQDSDSDETMDQ